MLYSHDSMVEALRWINAAFDRQQQGFIDTRGRWLALVLLGVVALAWPLSAMLPVASLSAAGANLGWKQLLLASIAPALLTPLLLWKMPTDFLPILLGDYLTLHFMLYGVLTAADIVAFASRCRSAPCRTDLVEGHRDRGKRRCRLQYHRLGPPDRRLRLFIPADPGADSPDRSDACGTLPYFIADEWLTRGADTRRGAYAWTKFCFLLSLAIAVALNPMKLFFLVIIVLPSCCCSWRSGLISRWSYQATQHPLPGALANAAMFAWAIAVTFPMIVR